MNNTAAILLACLCICFIAYSSLAYYQSRCDAKRQGMLREEYAQRRYERARSAVSPAQGLATILESLSKKMPKYLKYLGFPASKLCL